MICPVHARCGRWGMLISAIAGDVISFPLATLTVLGGAVLLMLETSAVFMKKCPLAPVLAIAAQVLGIVWVGLQIEVVATETK